MSPSYTHTPRGGGSRNGVFSRLPMSLPCSLSRWRRRPTSQRSFFSSSNVTATTSARPTASGSTRSGVFSRLPMSPPTGTRTAATTALATEFFLVFQCHIGPPSSWPASAGPGLATEFFLVFQCHNSSAAAAVMVRVSQRSFFSSSNVTNTRDAPRGRQRCSQRSFFSSSNVTGSGRHSPRVASARNGVFSRLPMSLVRDHVSVARSDTRNGVFSRLPMSLGNQRKSPHSGGPSRNGVFSRLPMSRNWRHAGRGPAWSSQRGFFSSSNVTRSPRAACCPRRRLATGFFSVFQCHQCHRVPPERPNES